MVRASPYARHTLQNILPGEVNKAEPDKSKKARLVWDGTTKVHWHEISMNEITPTTKEADITFGYVYMAFCVWLYNLRNSFSQKISFWFFLIFQAVFVGQEFSLV